MTDDDRSARASGAANEVLTTPFDLQIETVEWVGDDPDKRYRLVTFASEFRLDKITVFVSSFIPDDEIIAAARARVHDFASHLAVQAQHWAAEADFSESPDKPQTV